MAGATGPSEVLVATGTASGFTNTFIPIATLALNPGQYLVLGKVWVTDLGTSFQTYTCQIDLPGNVSIDEAAEALGNNSPVFVSSGSIALGSVLTLTETTAVALRCADNGSTQSSALFGKLFAVRVGAITEQ